MADGASERPSIIVRLTLRLHRPLHVALLCKLLGPFSSTGPTQYKNIKVGHERTDNLKLQLETSW